MKIARTLAVLTAIVAVTVPCVLAEVTSPVDLSSVGAQTRETSLGDLVADAVRAELGTPVALVPAGELREVTIAKGKVNPDDVVACLQYPGDRLAVIELTGDQLIRALERSVSIYPQKNMGFLQVSGIQVRFNPKSPKGSRIVSVKIGAEAVVNDRKYRIAVTRSLASGAYGYFTIWGKDLKPESKEKTASQAVKGYLAGRDSVDYRELKRVTAEKAK